MEKFWSTMDCHVLFTSKSDSFVIYVTQRHNCVNYFVETLAILKDFTQFAIGKRS